MSITMHHVLIFLLASASLSGHAVKRVLVIGIDGLKGTELHRCINEKCAPNIKNLADNGVSAPCPTVLDKRCARAHDGFRRAPSYEWSSGPGWAAVTTGLNVKKHNIKDNGHDNFKAFLDVTKHYPTMFKIAKDANIGTVVAGVGAFLTSHDEEGIYPGVIDYECGFGTNGPNLTPDVTASCNATYRKAFFSDSDTRDEELSTYIIEQIEATDAGLIMGVLDQVDQAGHEHGFSDNQEYSQAIARADELVGRMVAATENTGEQWLYIITSDHGGHKDVFGRGGSHNHMHYHDEVVPFVVATNTLDRLRPLKYPVRHMDVNPTALAWLDLPVRRGIDGRTQAIPETSQNGFQHQCTFEQN